MDIKLVGRALQFHGVDLLHSINEEQQEKPSSAILSYLDNYQPPDYEIKDTDFQRKVSAFIGRKSDLLFRPLTEKEKKNEQDKIKKKENKEDSIDGKIFRPQTEEEKENEKKEDSIDDSYAIMPALEVFMNVPSRERRELFFKSLKPCDCVTGVVSSLLENGLRIRLLCVDKGCARDIEDLEIMAFCPAKELPKLYAGESALDAFQEKDIVRGIVLVVSSEVERIIVSLHDKAIPDKTSYPRIGLITEDEFPVYFRRKSQIQGMDYNEMLHSILGFNNQGNVKALVAQQGIQDTASYLRYLARLKIPEKEYAEGLKKWQSQKLAHQSVAQGVDKFKEGKYLEAMQHFSRALQIDPQNVEALVARGALYANKENFHHAIQDFEEALSVNPKHGNARNYLIETLLTFGKGCEDKRQLEEACEHYQHVLRVDRDNVEAREMLQGCQHLMVFQNVSEKLTCEQKEQDEKADTSGSSHEESSLEKKSTKASLLSHTTEKLKRLIQEDEKRKSRGRKQKKRHRSSGRNPSEEVKPKRHKRNRSSSSTGSDGSSSGGSYEKRRSKKSRKSHRSSADSGQSQADIKKSNKKHRQSSRAKRHKTAEKGERIPSPDDDTRRKESKGGQAVRGETRSPAWEDPKLEDVFTKTIQRLAAPSFLPLSSSEYFGPFTIPGLGSPPSLDNPEAQKGTFESGNAERETNAVKVQRSDVFLMAQREQFYNERRERYTSFRPRSQTRSSSSSSTSRSSHSRSPHRVSRSKDRRSSKSRSTSTLSDPSRITRVKETQPDQDEAHKLKPKTTSCASREAEYRRLHVRASRSRMAEKSVSKHGRSDSEEGCHSKNKREDEGRKSGSYNRRLQLGSDCSREEIRASDFKHSKPSYDERFPRDEGYQLENERAGSSKRRDNLESQEKGSLKSDTNRSRSTESSQKERGKRESLGRSRSISSEHRRRKSSDRTRSTSSKRERTRSKEEEIAPEQRRKCLESSRSVSPERQRGKSLKRTRSISAERKRRKSSERTRSISPEREGGRRRSAEKARSVYSERGGRRRAERGLRESTETTEREERQGSTEGARSISSPVRGLGGTCSEQVGGSRKESASLIEQNNAGQDMPRRSGSPGKIEPSAELVLAASKEEMKLQEEPSTDAVQGWAGEDATQAGGASQKEVSCVKRVYSGFTPRVLCLAKGNDPAGLNCSQPAATGGKKTKDLEKMKSCEAKKRWDQKDRPLSAGMSQTVTGGRIKRKSGSGAAEEKGTQNSEGQKRSRSRDSSSGDSPYHCSKVKEMERTRSDHCSGAKGRERTREDDSHRGRSKSGDSSSRSSQHYSTEKKERSKAAGSDEKREAGSEKDGRRQEAEEIKKRGQEWLTVGESKPTVVSEIEGAVARRSRWDEEARPAQSGPTTVAVRVEPIKKSRWDTASEGEDTTTSATVHQVTEQKNGWSFDSAGNKYYAVCGLELAVGWHKDKYGNPYFVGDVIQGSLHEKNGAFNHEDRLMNASHHEKLTAALGQGRDHIENGVSGEHYYLKGVKDVKSSNSRHRDSYENVSKEKAVAQLQSKGDNKDRDSDNASSGGHSYSRRGSSSRSRSKSRGSQPKSRDKGSWSSSTCQRLWSRGRRSRSRDMGSRSKSSAQRLWSRDRRSRSRDRGSPSSSTGQRPWFRDRRSRSRSTGQRHRRSRSVSRERKSGARSVTSRSESGLGGNPFSHARRISTGSVGAEPSSSAKSENKKGFLDQSFPQSKCDTTDSSFKQKGVESKAEEKNEREDGGKQQSLTEMEKFLIDLKERKKQQWIAEGKLKGKN